MKLENSKEEALICARAAIEKKASHLKILEVSQVGGFTDYFVVCSAGNERQAKAISDAIQSALLSSGEKTLSTEGYTDGRWILMDYGDVVVHVFLEPLREYYDIETLWSHAPHLPVPGEYYGPMTTRLN